MAPRLSRQSAVLAPLLLLQSALAFSPGAVVALPTRPHLSPPPPRARRAAAAAMVRKCLSVAEKPSVARELTAILSQVRTGHMHMHMHAHAHAATTCTYM